jgi:DNA mismatch repair protein MutS2
MISDLESKRVIIERTENELRKEKESIEKLRASIEKEEASLDAKKASLLEEAHKDAANIIKNAKDEADRTIKEIRKLRSQSPDLNKMESLRTSLSGRLNEEQAHSSIKIPVKHSNNKIKPSDLHIGDKVKVSSMNLTGTIHSLPDKKGDITVSMGIMQTKVKLDDIELIPEEDTAKRFRKEKRQSSSYSFTGGSAATISPEIKLIGLTVNEAISRLDKYLDEAYVSHLKSVRIVHGKGTGALRKAVHDYLDNSAYVKKYSDASYGEGDSGVTVAELY